MESANEKLSVVGSAPQSKPGPKKIRITQDDLADEELLRQQAKAANATLRQKRREIRDALEAGAAVEPGIRHATLQDTKVLIIR